MTTIAHTTRVLKPAIRTEGGEIITIDPPKTHRDLVENVGFFVVRDGVYGFLLTDGSFVSRSEAAQVALAAGQATKLTAAPYLSCEDLIYGN